MKRFFNLLLAAQFMLTISRELFSQSETVMQEFGITAGGFTNFPLNQHYLKDGISVFYVAPYLSYGRHEFSAGVLYPLTTKALDFTDKNISSQPGAIAGYKFYVFNAAGRENLFVHYSFQYLRFKGNYDIYYTGSSQPHRWTETDTYINNVIGLGYNLFFDTDERFGFYYTLDYMVTQTGFRVGPAGTTSNYWHTQYIWNNLSTHLGFSFKLTSLNKKSKK